MDLKNFDITQLNKDTKVVVFKIPKGIDRSDDHSMSQLLFIFKKIKEDLDKSGIVALFLDEAFEVTPLTDEMLSSERLKTI